MATCVVSVGRLEMEFALEQQETAQTNPKSHNLEGLSDAIMNHYRYFKVVISRLGDWDAKVFIFAKSFGMHHHVEVGVSSTHSTWFRVGCDVSPCSAPGNMGPLGKLNG
jgi:hypothetical protein